MRIGIYAAAHATAADLGVFRSAVIDADCQASFAARCGSEILDICSRLPRDSVDHVVISGHGGPTWLLDDEHGISTGTIRRSDEESVGDLARELAPALRPGALVSLAACLCSRSPTWLLMQAARAARAAHVAAGGRMGRAAEKAISIGSDWGLRAYQPGGLASLSARLRDLFAWYDAPVRVRGHRAAGHAVACPILAEHSWPATDPCEPLFSRALPGVAPDGAARRRWAALVQGDLARRWLLGDDSVEAEIRARWS